MGFFFFFPLFVFWPQTDENKSYICNAHKCQKYTQTCLQPKMCLGVIGRGIKTVTEDNNKRVILAKNFHVQEIY